MKKIILILTCLLSISFSFSDKIQVIDDEKLVGVSEIDYTNEEEFEKKVNELLLNILEKGYITSKLVSEENNIKIDYGRIAKVILNDEATDFDDLKKFTLSLDELEGKVFNIEEINEVVNTYSKYSSNDIEIEINQTEDNDVDVILNNKYKFKKGLSLVMSSSNLDLNYDVLLNFNQIIGLNDELNLNYNALKNSHKFSLAYNVPIKNNDLFFRYTYQGNKLNKDVYDFENDYLISLNTKMINEKDMLLNQTNSFTYKTNIQDIRDVRLKNVKYYEYENKLEYSKMFKLLNTDFILDLESKFLLALAKEMYLDTIFNLNLKAALKSKYHLANIEYFMARQLESKYVEHDKYTYTNNGTSINDYPLKISNEEDVLILNNTFNYPIFMNNLTISPKLDFAFAKLTKENVLGLGVGVDLNYNLINFGLRFVNDTKNNKYLNTKLIINWR